MYEILCLWILIRSDPEKSEIGKKNVFFEILWKEDDFFNSNVDEQKIVS